jgi:restriction endonuclease S subunit
LQKLLIPIPSLPDQQRIVAKLDEQMATLDRAEKALAEQRAAACALTIAVSQRTFHGPESEKWPSVYIRDVCTVVNGFGFPEYLQGSTTLRYPFVKVSDMNAPGASEVVSSAANTVDEEILRTLGARVYPAGTVIFPKVGGALLTNKKRVLGTASCFDNNVMGLVPTGIDSRFLFLWFRTVDLRTLANTQALPSVRQSAVAALGMPLPSPAEQRRIVARLDEQMTALDHAERVLADRQTDVAALRTTLLNAAFSGEV